MIRFKDLVFEEYSIDPATAVITDKCGNVLRQSKHRGRPIVYLNGESITVHCIQAHTHIGYDKKLVVHHKDFDKTNNAVDNLQLMTKAEHAHVHYEYTLKGKGWQKGQPAHNKGVPCSYEQRAKISAKIKGMKKWNNGITNMYAKDCPR